MAEDIVDEQVELRLIDTRQLVAEAKKLKEAKRIADEAKKIKPQTSFSQAPFVTPSDTIPKSQQKAQTRVGAIKGQNTFSAFTDMQKKLKELEKKQKNSIKKINEFQDKFVDKLDTAKSFLSSGSIAGGALGVFGGIASKFGPIGIMVTAIVASIVPQFFQEFERGGIFSTALKITEREKNIVDIDFVVDVRSGTKFLTSDLRMAQKAPETSNTLNLRYEHIRYTSQELGR